MFYFWIFRWFQSSLTYHDSCGPHWWLRSYSSQASEGYKLKAECLFLICLEQVFSLNCKFWHIFRSSDKVVWCLEDLWLKQKRKESERERQRQNRIPVIAHTCWKKLLHKFFPWALNRLLFSKNGWIGFSFVQEWKSNFYCQLELNNNYLYSLGHKEKVDLFVCFGLKSERTTAFFDRLPKWFSMCLDSDKKILLW